MTKVAVVAVHGVADQKPASSARAVADLLCTDPEYGSFTEVSLRIARDRMDPGSDLAENADAGLLYMQQQLKQYRDPNLERDEGTVYDTVRLEGKRLRDGAKVHVHEVYWADLSRAGDTWYRLLAEFYQLILHLPSLGRNGLAYAKSANGNTIPWRAAHRIQRFAVWLLTVPAALLNLVLLSIGVITLSVEVPAWWRYGVAIAVAAMLIGGGVIALMRLAGAKRRVWSTWPWILIGAIAISVWLVDQRWTVMVLAIEGAIVAAIACCYIAAKYDVLKRRRALPFGIPAALVMLGVAIVAITVPRANTEAAVYDAALLTAETVYPALKVTWLLIFVTGVLAAFAGVFAAATTKGAAERAAAWRAAWTARFSFGMPVALFAIFTLSIWYLVIEGIALLASDSAPHVADAIRVMLTTSARGFEFSAIALVGFVFVALTAAVPSVIAEIRHPRPSTDDDSTALGQWLTKRIPRVAWAAELFTLALVFMLVTVTVKGFRTPLEPWLEPILRGASAAVALMITGKYFIKTFRAAVDVLLDIDNYLRESPEHATPRARIAERFVSLLRHLCEWRDTDGKPYEQIIIVAHSQGTVIAADALRYVNKFPDARLEAINKDRIRLRLFTMGSPLRQLYAQAFPHLYAWITEADRGEQMISPDPTRLTLQQWANVYCSGDYVGRNLWVAEEDRIWMRAKPTPSSVGPDGKVLPRVDFCAGAGAHTHYWDHNGSDVAAYLKSIV